MGMSSITYTLGNLSDGIFLLVPPVTQIDDNLISNNRAAGIHAATQTAGTQTTGALTILGNFIGTDNTGESIIDKNNVSLGNGSDGVFLDAITSGATIGGTVMGSGGTPVGAPNVISANHANGIDLLNSSAVSITGNMIGTDAKGTMSKVVKPDGTTLIFGNASDGISIKQSNPLDGGTTATIDSNVISG